MEQLEISIDRGTPVGSWPNVLDPILRQQEEPLRIPPRSKPELKWLRVSPISSAKQVAPSVFFAHDLKRGCAVGMIQKDRPHRNMERGLTVAHEHHCTIVTANVEFKLTHTQFESGHVLIFFALRAYNRSGR